MPTPNAEPLPISTPSFSSSILTRALHASCPPEDASATTAATDTTSQPIANHDGVMDKVEDVDMQVDAASGATEDHSTVAHSPSSSSIDHEDVRHDNGRMDFRHGLFSAATPPKPSSPLELRTISPNPFRLSRINSNGSDGPTQNVSMHKFF